MNPQLPIKPFCAICASEIVGEPYREPLGRDNALVNVCSRCNDEVVPERDHLFGRLGIGVGDGNKRAKARS